MKAYMALADTQLNGTIQHIQGITAALPYELSDVVEEGKHLFLLSDLKCNYQEAVQVKQKYPESFVIYLMTDPNSKEEIKLIESILLANGINVVPPFRVDEQIIEDIERICFNKIKRRSFIVTGIGATPQIGLTSALLKIGQELTNMTDKPLGYLGFNAHNPGTSLIQYNGKFLDDNSVWGACQGKNLYAADLMQRMDEIYPGLHYLAGNTDLLKIFFYTKEGAAWLLNEAQKAFQHLLFVDVGSYINHALAAQAIYSSDLIIVSMNQSEYTRENWTRMYNQIIHGTLNIDPKKIVLLCNKMYGTSDVIKAGHISKETDLYSIASLPYISTFHQAEIHKNLFQFKNDEYDREIRKAATTIATYFDIPIKQLSDKKTNREGSRGIFPKFLQRGTS